MRKSTKLLIITLLIVVILLMQQKTFANNLVGNLSLVEYTDEYQSYLQLTEEEQRNILPPRMFKIENTNIKTKNPLRLARSVGSSLETRFSLKDKITNNVVVKNQEKTNSCWAFATLSSLETNLALNSKNQSKVYDFSERHMDYATSREFANNKINPKGFNRKAVKDGGNWDIAISYLVNGMGAVEETSMPFEDNEDLIDISAIQNKKVTSEVYDTITFPSCKDVEDITQEMKQQMKEHIKNHGSIFANIHGASPISDYCNNETGAIYCDDKEKCNINHAVSIIGWDDEYAIDNFKEEHRPTNKGAWIIKNSWGDKLEYTIAEMKEEIFKNLTQNDYGWTKASDIPDEIAKVAFKNIGFTIKENGEAYLPMGDKGFMYISYEDVNIYSNLYGIEKASDNTDYENIYQYNDLGSPFPIELDSSEIYLGNIFKKNTTGKEYLTQVALDAPEAYTCKVYVNANGKSMEKKDLELVTLKAGNTESFNAGYHTLEFAKPIEITSDEFAIVIEIQGTRDGKIYFSAEANVPNTAYNVVETETGKCFCTTRQGFDSNVWQDLSEVKEIPYKLDSSIKAFTVSKVEDNIQEPEEEKGKIQNSNFERAKSDIKIAKLYTFTNQSKDEYVEMQIEVNNITRNLDYDECEYYYYLSPNKSEQNIENWIKITEKQTSKDKIVFTINTNDMKNNKEISDADTLYLYVKEVITKGENQSVMVSNPISIEANNATLEIYIDDVKYDITKLDSILGNTPERVTSEQKDKTMATKILPDTGIETFFMITVLVAIIGLGIYKYVRYKNLSKYIK